MRGGRAPGHRQRGAGTVAVSMGEVCSQYIATVRIDVQTADATLVSMCLYQTMRQGVLCKEWQRTPMQLLHEYCQSKKRRNAFYPTAKASEGKFRCVSPTAA